MLPAPYMREWMMLRWLCLICLTLCVGLLSCAGRSKSRFGTGLPTVAASPQEAALEREMFDRLNRDRQQRGLPALSYDDQLADIARYHSRDMRDQGFFGHDSPTTGSPQDRIDRAGYLATESRENVAQAPDVTIAQDQLLQSPGHYANIVATTVTHVGIGVVQDKKVPGQVRGYFFTQLFASPVVAASADDARAVVIEKVARARRQAGLPALQMHPLLERLAKEHVDRVDAQAPGRTLSEIGDTLAAQLGKEQGHDFQSLESGAQVGLSAEMFRPEDMLDKNVRAIGFAIASDKDAQGKPVLKMLFIVGR